LQAEAWCGQHRAEAAPEGLSPELLELLRQWGYIGPSGAPSQPAPPTPPPDAPRH